MSRPSQHGGGQAGPPIAGDPNSFPTDAELARTLTSHQQQATLSTLTAEGFPYGSAVSYAPDASGAPVVLISDMAEHTVNARQDTRASFLIAATTPEQADPLSTARMTLVGHLNLIEDRSEVRDLYLATHPYAEYYCDFTDFGFWRLEVQSCRYVGGFGHMSWVTGEGYAEASIDPVSEVADGVINHMNADHAEANLMYAQVLADLPDATEATMVGVDRYGVTLQVATPDAPRMARIPFPAPLQAADEARDAVIALLHAARAQAEA